MVTTTTGGGTAEIVINISFRIRGNACMGGKEGGREGGREGERDHIFILLIALSKN